MCRPSSTWRPSLVDAWASRRGRCREAASRPQGRGCRSSNRAPSVPIGRCGSNGAGRLPPRPRACRCTAPASLPSGRGCGTRNRRPVGLVVAATPSTGRASGGPSTTVQATSLQPLGHQLAVTPLRAAGGGRLDGYGGGNGCSDTRNAVNARVLRRGRYKEAASRPQGRGYCSTNRASSISLGRCGSSGARRRPPRPRACRCTAPVSLPSGRGYGTRNRRPVGLEGAVSPFTCATSVDLPTMRGTAPWAAGSGTATPSDATSMMLLTMTAATTTATTTGQLATR